MIKKAFVMAAFLTASFTTIFMSFYGCQTNESKARDSITIINKNIQDGRMLAQQYCSTCHLPVTADFLNKETWLKHVLPAMAPRLGIAVYAEDQYVNNTAKKSTVSYDDWMKIVNYYRKTAPATLNKAKLPVPLVKDWAVFTLKKPTVQSNKISTTTMVSIDTNSHTIYSADATTNDIYSWNQNLNSKIFAHLPSPAVDIKYPNKDQSIVTCIGNMQAIDVAEGAVLAFNRSAPATKPDIITSNLPRPVQSVAADFNKDGLTDYVVCGFGHNIGGLYWLKQNPGNQYEKINIRGVSGALRAVVGDYNNDGWPDIMCLFAQAQEGVWLFLNNRHGGFSTQNLIRFLPVFGSSSFDVADFNHDGKPDILYTCGDNSDYSRILKPYHGVYIYLNQGNFKFKKSYFYPVDGCTKAVAADLDGDGDLDIASIAFFSDFKNNPSEGFIYFEQDKPLHFIPHAVPVSNYGRWICMDVNDLNHDGKLDIVLGNFSLGFNNIVGFKPNWNLKMPLIVLENTSGKNLTK